MAGRGLKHMTAYRFFASPAAAAAAAEVPAAAADEFDESDIMWGYCEPEAADQRKPMRSGRKGGKPAVAGGAMAASMPMNIPDWSKILRGEYQRSGGGSPFGEEEEEEEGVVVPPHELLWRSRAASFSVQEGIGRTLKGRDLRRVRNAIWEKTGFQD